MALIDQDIDFTNVQASTGTGVLPASEYILAVVDSDVKTSAKNSEHRYVDITFQVLDGPYKGRKLFVKYNIKNSNETTQNIARSELKALREAIGMINNDETQAWHNIRFRGQVIVKAGKDQFNNERPENKINQYNPLAKPAAQAAGYPPVAQTNAPWGAPAPQSAPVQSAPVNQAAFQVAPNNVPPFIQLQPIPIGSQSIVGSSHPGVAYVGQVQNPNTYPIPQDLPIGQ